MQRSLPDILADLFSFSHDATQRNSVFMLCLQKLEDCHLVHTVNSVTHMQYLYT